MWLFNATKQHLPKATGSLIPGCMDVMLDYCKDGIFMRLYYPTNHKSEDPQVPERWRPWIPDDSYIVGIAKVLMSFTIFIRIAFWWSANIRIPAVYGAKPLTEKKLKCIIFSHGLGGHRFLNSTVCCELASRGFLVAALEHRDQSASNTFYYQSKEDAINKIRTEIDHKRVELGPNHFEKRNKQVNYRANECCKALDFLIGLNKGVVPHNVIHDVPTRRQIDFDLEDLSGNLDLDSIVMSGHSFGGATALLSLSKREELKVGILLDPWMFSVKNEGLVDKVKQPLLFINTQTFHIATNVDAMSKFLVDDSREMYTILHSTHENQTDSVFLVGYWLNWFMKKLNPLIAIRINNAILLGFLNRQIKYPTDIEDCKQILEEQRDNVAIGLTKPWA